MKTSYERYKKNCPNLYLPIGYFEEVYSRYAEIHRHFHNWKHVETIWDIIDSGFDYHNMNPFNTEQKEVLYCAALFHDSIYFPQNKDNEERSASLVVNYMNHHKGFDTVQRIILSTKNHNPKLEDFKDMAECQLAFAFCKYDMESAEQMNFYDYELSVFKEYQKFSIEEYRKGRLEFLKSTGWEDMDMRIKFAKEWKPNVGVFIGTFNNFHSGHMNILEKASDIFDKVIVLCAYNPSKGTDIESVVKQVRECLPFHQVDSFGGLVTDYIKKVESMGAKVTVVKGFRTDQDVPYELNLYRYTQLLKPDISYCLLPCDHEFDFISSSGLKQLEKLGGDISKFKPTKYDYAKGLI